MQELVALENYDRLDSYLSFKLNISRSKVSKMIKEHKVTLNNKKCKGSASVSINDVIRYELINEEYKCDAEDIPLDIIYEDEDIIIRYTDFENLRTIYSNGLKGL